MKIAILGDVHGNWARFLHRIILARDRYGAERIIQVGDFGFFPGRIKELFSLTYALPLPVHVIDGNHEDHRWLKKAFIDDVWAEWDDRGLHYHARGSAVTVGSPRSLGGCRIGFIGGALHADRRQRGSIVQGTTNWVTGRDIVRALHTFRESPPDLIVSHTCPAAIGVRIPANPDLYASASRYIADAGFDGGTAEDPGDGWLRSLWRTLMTRPRTWVFGHFHAHHRVDIDGATFACVGSCDGDGGDDERITYLYDTYEKQLIVERWQS